MMARLVLISLFLIFSFQGQANAYACYSVGEKDIEELLKDAHYFGLMKLVKTDENFHYIENIQTYWGAEDGTFMVNKKAVMPDSFYPSEGVLFEHVIYKTDKGELKFLSGCKNYLLSILEKHHEKAKSSGKFMAIEQECSDQNGDFLYLSDRNIWYCAIRAADEGKNCQLAKDCEGLCLVYLTFEEDKNVGKQWSLNYCTKTGLSCLYKESEVGRPIKKQGQCSEYKNAYGQFNANNKDGVAERVYCNQSSCSFNN